MADLGDMFRNGLGRTTDCRPMLEQIANQRTKEANDGEIFYIGYVPNTEEETKGLPSDYYEGYEYYRISPAKLLFRFTNPTQ